jgi:acetyl/propionyl-CoA carboxylase alpha subunit
LEQTVVLGVETNQTFLLQLLSSDFFIKGETYTTTLEEGDWGERPVPDLLVQSASAVFAGEFPEKSPLARRLRGWRLL